MRLAVYGHCAIDKITIGDAVYDQIGGSACYCSITARRFGFDVDLHTKFGSDFPAGYLEDNDIRLVGAESSLGTTRFAINVRGAGRNLRLVSQCEPLQYLGSDADGCIVSPIFGEISEKTFGMIKQDSDFLMLDPQGFLRRQDQDGNVELGRADVDLSGVDALKVSVEEAACMADGSHSEMMSALNRKGARYVILANREEISLLAEGRIYSITLPNKSIYDTTGAGDVFCAAFSCTMLKERDFLWALCFAGGAVQALLDSKQVGLQKIPSRGAIQTNASYFYNLVKFRDA